MGQRSRSKSRSLAIPRVHLSATEIRRLPKPRGGFIGPTQQLLAIVAEQPDAVVVKGLDLAATLAKLSQYQAMTTEVRDKKLDFEMAADTQLQIGSEIWQVTLLVYQHVKAAARNNPEVQAALAPFEAFMKKGRKKRKQSTPPPTPAAA